MTVERGKVHRAARIATERREARGLPPLPRVTPHTLRHTYISILLLVTDNVTYVMEQRQEHGAAFDQVIGQAREAFGTPGETGAFVG